MMIWWYQYILYMMEPFMLYIQFENIKWFFSFFRQYFWPWSCISLYSHRYYLFISHIHKCRFFFLNIWQNPIFIKVILLMIDVSILRWFWIYMLVRIIHIVTCYNYSVPVRVQPKMSNFSTCKFIWVNHKVES